MLDTEERTSQRMVTRVDPRGANMNSVVLVKQKRDRFLVLKMTLTLRPGRTVVQAAELPGVDLKLLKKKAQECVKRKETRRQLDEILSRVRLGFDLETADLSRLEGECQDCLAGHLPDNLSRTSLDLTYSIANSPWREH